MKKLYFTLLLTLPFFGESQIVYSILDQNNVSASISDGGTFFNSATSTNAYHVPKDSMQGLIYSATNWFGGVDVGGQLKLIGTYLDGTMRDLWPGPLTTNGSAYAGTNPLGATIWSVSKAEIYYHLTHFQDPGYVLSNAIASWPAHGDVSLGYDFLLAPFVDVDLDGVYNPLVGDYPCIKGDRATFMIMNDKKDVHGSGADPIGLELQYMIYQYDNPELNDVTFIDLKIINRGTQTLFDFYTSFVMDGDLGNSMDDFFGCDTLRNAQYYYNDTFDEDNLGITGYGDAPPSFGVVCLSDTISSSVTLNSGFGVPNTPLGKYNAMRGIKSDGSSFLDNNFNPTTFMYPDPPSNPSGWSEINSMGSGPGDKKTIMSVNMGTISAFAEKNISYAVVYSRAGNSNIDNVDSLLVKIDKVQTFYDSSTDGNCGQSILALEEKVIENIQIFPNPSSGEFQINIDNLTHFDLTIQDMAGRIIMSANDVEANSKILLDAPSGIYIAMITTEKGVYSKRISIR